MRHGLDLRRRRPVDDVRIPGTGAEPSGLAVSIDGSAIPARTGGVGRYLIGLLGGLATHGGYQLTFYATAGDTARWQRAYPDLAVSDIAPAARPLRLAWEQLVLPRRIRQTALTVHHSPHYTMPGLATVARVVTIHDMTFISHPQWHQRYKVPFFRYWIDRACREADVLVCVSNVTAERLLEFRRPRGQVVVAPHGVDLTMFSPARPEQDVTPVLNRYGIRRPYVLFLGTVEPRKDVPGLVKAFDALSEKHQDLSLVIGGSPGWDEARVKAATRQARHRDRIRRIGYVPEDQVPDLLRQAAVVAYPSFEEGFGLPVLEALACGAPVVTTAGTAMAEASGGAARLIAAGNTSQLAEAIDDLLTGGFCAAARERGLAVAARYTWAASAGKHLEAYRLAAASR